MPFRISLPQIQQFPLTGIDPSGETIVEIKQATQAAVERRAAATESRTHILGEGENQVKIISKFNYPELQRVEAYLTMTSCNVEAADGGHLFKFKQSRSGFPMLDMSEEDFELAWGRLPSEVADEIHNCVLAVNPMWSFNGEAREDF